MIYNQIKFYRNSVWTGLISLCIAAFTSVIPATAEEARIVLGKPDQNIERFYNLFNRDTLYLVDEFYDPQVKFIDPIVQLNNREELTQYYKDMYKGVESITFEFSGEIVQGDEHMVLWKMIMIAKKLNKGKPVTVEGVSHIRFGGDEGKAVYHRDYFDVGAMVYEHVPIVGGLTRYVKKKLHGNLNKKD